jgi:hypothetical protein
MLRIIPGAHMENKGVTANISGCQLQIRTDFRTRDVARCKPVTREPNERRDSFERLSVDKQLSQYLFVDLGGVIMARSRAQT